MMIELNLIEVEEGKLLDLSLAREENKTIS
jgi:hypothetical protein